MAVIYENKKFRIIAHTHTNGTVSGIVRMKIEHNISVTWVRRATKNNYIYLRNGEEVLPQYIKNIIKEKTNIEILKNQLL